MSRIIIINASPRKGNTSFIIDKIVESNGKTDESIDKDIEVINLKDIDISKCKGCLYCHEKDACIIVDDMQPLYKKLLEANIIVFATPNYFDNVSGLGKDFIDRTNPFYFKKNLFGKKFIGIVTGGMKKWHSQRVLDEALTYFCSAQKMEFVGKFAFVADAYDDLKNNELQQKKIDEILDLLRNL